MPIAHPMAINDVAPWNGTTIIGLRTTALVMAAAANTVVVIPVVFVV
jgi:hypothetical protein